MVPSSFILGRKKITNARGHSRSRGARVSSFARIEEELGPDYFLIKGGGMKLGNPISRKQGRERTNEWKKEFPPVKTAD